MANEPIEMLDPRPETDARSKLRRPCAIEKDQLIGEREYALMGVGYA